MDANGMSMLGESTFLTEFCLRSPSFNALHLTSWWSKLSGFNLDFKKLSIPVVEYAEGLLSSANWKVAADFMMMRYTDLCLHNCLTVRRNYFNLYSLKYEEKNEENTYADLFSFLFYIFLFFIIPLPLSWKCFLSGCMNNHIYESRSSRDKYLIINHT